MSVLLFLFLAFLTSIPAALIAFRAGQKSGFKRATVPTLEILDTFQSGNVFWRYGPGHTDATGYCHKNNFPAGALEAIDEHEQTTRHEAAADALMDDFFSKRGVYRNQE